MQANILELKNKVVKKLFKKDNLALVNPHSLFFIFLQVSIFLSSFICLRWLSPEKVGIWQTMTLIESYILFMRFGVLNAFNRDYSFFLGKGDKEKADKIFDTTEVFSLTLGALIFTLFLGYFFFFGPTSKDWRLAILASSVIIPANIYKVFLTLTYRTSRDFTKLAKVQVRMAVIYLASTILVYLYSFNGYVLRFLIIALMYIFLYSYYRTKPRNFKFSLEEFVYLFKLGLPMFAFNYINSLVKSFPKVLILYFSTISVLGLFSPVQAVISFSLLLPTSISYYLIPYLNFTYGKGESKKQILAKSIKAIKLSFFVLCPIVLIGWMLIPVFVEFWLPKYVDSILPMRFSIFLGLTGVFKLLYSSYLTLKDWKRMYYHLGVLVISNLLIPFLLITFLKHDNILVPLIIGLLLCDVIVVIFSFFHLNFDKK